MDGFHFSQALQQLTTTQYDDVYDALYDYVLFNNKADFTRLCNEFLDLNPERRETIENKRDYILNNWNARQPYQNSHHMRCSMELIFLISSPIFLLLVLKHILKTV